MTALPRFIRCTEAARQTRMNALLEPDDAAAPVTRGLRPTVTWLDVLRALCDARRTNVMLGVLEADNFCGYAPVGGAS